MGNANGKDGGTRPVSKGYQTSQHVKSAHGHSGAHAKSDPRPAAAPVPTPAIDVSKPSPGKDGMGRAPVPYKRPKGSNIDSDSDEEGDSKAGEAEAVVSAASEASGGAKVGLKDFEPLKVIGNGCFGKVMMVRYKKNGKIFAMKSIRKAHVVKNKKVRHTQTERNIMQKLNHPYVMKLHYAFQNNGKLYMVMDYLNGGDIFYHLSVSRRFSEERARFYAAEVTLALECLHSNGLVYRDLKPENVLTDSEGHIRLTDFGLSKEDFVEGSQMNTFVGTTEYLAPEVLKQKGYGKEVDWWSLGVLVFEMLTGCPPFYSKNRQMTFRMILSAELNVPEWLSPNARQIIRDLLVRDPSQRLGAGVADAKAIRGHVFFSSVDWTALSEKKVSPPYTPPPLANDDTSHFDTRFTTKPAEDSPTPSPEEHTSFLGFSYQSSTYNDRVFHAAAAGASIPEGAPLDDKAGAVNVPLGSLGGSFKPGSMGKHSHGAASYKSSTSHKGASSLPRINSGQDFAEEPEDKDNDTVWVPNMPAQEEGTMDGEGEDYEDSFEKLGTSLIQSSLANKSPRWREHDSQRGNVREVSSSDSLPEDGDDDGEEDEEESKVQSTMPGLQFGIDIA